MDSSLNTKKNPEKLKTKVWMDKPSNDNTEVSSKSSDANKLKTFSQDSSAIAPLLPYISDTDSKNQLVRELIKQGININAMQTGANKDFIDLYMTHAIENASYSNKDPVLVISNIVPKLIEAKQELVNQCIADIRKQSNDITLSSFRERLQFIVNERINQELDKNDNLYTVSEASNTKLDDSKNFSQEFVTNSSEISEGEEIQDFSTVKALLHYINDNNVKDLLEVELDDTSNVEIASEKQDFIDLCIKDIMKDSDNSEEITDIMINALDSTKQNIVDQCIQDFHKQGEDINLLHFCKQLKRIVNNRINQELTTFGDTLYAILEQQGVEHWIERILEKVKQKDGEALHDRLKHATNCIREKLQIERKCMDALTRTCVVFYNKAIQWVKYKEHQDLKLSNDIFNQILSMPQKDNIGQNILWQKSVSTAWNKWQDVLIKRQTENRYKMLALYLKKDSEIIGPHEYEVKSCWDEGEDRIATMINKEKNKINGIINNPNIEDKMDNNYFEQLKNRWSNFVNDRNKERAKIIRDYKKDTLALISSFDENLEELFLNTMQEYPEISTYYLQHKMQNENPQEIQEDESPQLFLQKQKSQESLIMKDSQHSKLPIITYGRLPSLWKNLRKFLKPKDKETPYELIPYNLQEIDSIRLQEQEHEQANKSWAQKYKKIIEDDIKYIGEEERNEINFWWDDQITKQKKQIQSYVDEAYKGNINIYGHYQDLVTNLLVAKQELLNILNNYTEHNQASYNKWLEEMNQQRRKCEELESKFDIFRFSLPSEIVRKISQKDSSLDARSIPQKSLSQREEELKIKEEILRKREEELQNAEKDKIKGKVQKMFEEQKEKLKNFLKKKEEIDKLRNENKKLIKDLEILNRKIQEKNSKSAIKKELLYTKEELENLKQHCNNLEKCNNELEKLNKKLLMKGEKYIDRCLENLNVITEKMQKIGGTEKEVEELQVHKNEIEIDKKLINKTNNEIMTYENDQINDNESDLRHRYTGKMHEIKQKLENFSEESKIIIDYLTQLEQEEVEEQKKYEERDNWMIEVEAQLENITKGVKTLRHENENLKHENENLQEMLQEINEFCKLFVSNRLGWESKEPEVFSLKMLQREIWETDMKQKVFSLAMQELKLTWQKKNLSQSKRQKLEQQIDQWVQGQPLPQEPLEWLTEEHKTLVRLFLQKESLNALPQEIKENPYYKRRLDQQLEEWKESLSSNTGGANRTFLSLFT